MSRVAIIFDWDGTLYDSSYLLDEAIEAAHQKSGITLPISLLSHLYSPNINAASKLQCFLDALPKQLQPKFRREITIDFMRRERAACLFPGIENLIRYLHAQGVTLCLATGRERGRLSSDLSKLGLDDLFDSMVCAGEASAKPDPEMLLQLMQRLELHADRVMFVGDSQQDEQAARAAGILFIPVAMSRRDRVRIVFETANPSATCATSLASKIDYWMGNY
jgi:phosphoglycolate phosphatase